MHSGYFSSPPLVLFVLRSDPSCSEHDDPIRAAETEHLCRHLSSGMILGKLHEPKSPEAIFLGYSLQVVCEAGYEKVCIMTAVMGSSMMARPGSLPAFSFRVTGGHHLRKGMSCRPETKILPHLSASASHPCLCAGGRPILATPRQGGSWARVGMRSIMRRPWDRRFSRYFLRGPRALLPIILAT